MLNELISLLKDTTLVSVIALSEVGPGRPRNPGRNLQQLGADASAAIMFLIIILPLARLVDQLISRNQGQVTRGSHIEVA